MGQGDSLLKRIDSKEGSCDKLVDKMFNKLDTDGNGVLEGQEYEILMRSTIDYVVKNYHHSGASFDRSQLRVWVEQTLDPNQDKKVTKEELKENLKRLLEAEKMIARSKSNKCHS
eukprot:EG_transcript_40820